MDWAGLQLIKNNKPVFKQEPHYIDIEIIENFKIPEEWFLEKRIINSIHGVRHMMRSVIYAVYLSRYFGLNNVDRQALMIGSVLHDVRRMKDEGDSGHGLRSGQWLKNNLELVNHTFGTVLDNNYLLKVCQAIEFHEIPYVEMNTEQYTEYRKNRILVDLLKTVDALDRYRLTWLNDWPKDKYMRAIPPDWIKHVAYNMVVKSEESYLKTEDNWRSISTIEKMNQRSSWPKATLPLVGYRHQPA